MKDNEITIDDMDALLEFLPAFSVEGREFGRWVGGGTKDGVIRMPGLDYDEDVDEFFRLAAQDPWADRSYTSKDAGRMLGDDEFIARASLEEVKTMLTFAVRGEKFADGHRLAMLREGRIVALLRRLQVLRRRMQPGDEPSSR